jgi:hypothetical protein
MSTGPAARPPAAAERITTTAVDARDRARRLCGIGNFSRTLRQEGKAEGKAELSDRIEVTGNFSRTARQAELNCICGSPLECA